MTEITIKEARLALGLTQAALAKELGWTGSRQVSAIESGAKPVTAQTLLAVECLLWRAGKMPIKS